MTDTPSPGEVVERLEGRAAELEAAAEGRRYGVTSDQFNHTSADLRAAASLIRELTEREKGADDETYEIGVRDGYEKAIQDLDIATGGDGEFYGSTLPGRGVDGPVMKQRIIDRFDDQLATLKFIAPALLVLRNMCTRAGLKMGAAQADKMIAAVRKHLCDESPPPVEPQ